MRRNKSFVFAATSAVLPASAEWANFEEVDFDTSISTLGVGVPVTLANTDVSVRAICGAQYIGAGIWVRF